MEPEKRELSEVQQEHKYVQATVREAHKSLDLPISDLKLKAHENADWELTSMSPTSTDPSIVSQSMAQSVTPEVRPAAPVDTVSSVRRLSSGDAQVLSQFVLIQQVLKEIMNDLVKVDLLASRQLSMRRSFLEPLNRAEIEKKISSSMLFTEVNRSHSHVASFVDVGLILSTLLCVCMQTDDAAELRVCN